MGKRRPPSCTEGFQEAVLPLLGRVVSRSGGDKSRYTKSWLLALPRSLLVMASAFWSSSFYALEGPCNVENSCSGWYIHVGETGWVAGLSLRVQEFARKPGSVSRLSSLGNGQWRDVTAVSACKNIFVRLVRFCVPSPPRAIYSLHTAHHSTLSPSLSFLVSCLQYNV